ncbi:DI-GLUCOSE BINDING PROTEIN WITH LEUCINE-RICH REPEAT DOMAIN-CONTAINING PROTEIN [Salix viminalis]|uniref:DI-GLUCOSE BINDING PROTEIN WITH LEUCINE-RICH REPEAT DOMAIN-CONTAINING PROTEIN n=1 Tax=Salix viminalis TaxID=40686 RepID=A0A9Q0ZCM2_SALVM|nr:DI-GLUCOSE BINDING PROTEIN WITH LEUCINE-RICH REPEAT DOMAIN-CONTAINING PROTEIN [Salix viminalis]
MNNILSACFKYAKSSVTKQTIESLDRLPSFEPMAKQLHSLLSSCLLLGTLSIVLVHTPAQVHSITLESDVEVLQALKQGIDPVSIVRNSYLHSWDFAFDPCEDAGLFQGILCTFPTDKSVNRIMAIDLDPAGYDGFLTPMIGNLTELTSLSISRNNFRGPIPETIANLQRLTRLSLSQNLFSGRIPRGIIDLKHLEILDLSQNHLSGKIPADITALRSLVQLILSNNALSGKIPDLSGLWQLNTLDLSSNNLDGNVPVLPINLRKLSLSHNVLSGHISPVSVLQHLTALDLSDNRLSGLVRQEVLTLPLVVRINISNNQFTEMEAIPYPREDLQLRVLDAHANRLRGRLPISLVNIANLSSIDLSHNQFSGRIPSEYGAKLGISWKSLFLEDNFLIGNLPPQFVDGTVAVRANLAHNCLRCPPNIRFCRGGQRANSDCAGLQDHST